MKRPAIGSHQDCITLDSKLHKTQKEKAVTSYREAVEYMPEIYATEDGMASLKRYDTTHWTVK